MRSPSATHACSQSSSSSDSKRFSQDRARRRQEDKERVQLSSDGPQEVEDVGPRCTTTTTTVPAEGALVPLLPALPSQSSRGLTLHHPSRGHPDVRLSPRLVSSATSVDSRG